MNDGDRELGILGQEKLHDIMYYTMLSQKKETSCKWPMCP